MDTEILEAFKKLSNEEKTDFIRELNSQKWEVKFSEWINNIPQQYRERIQIVKPPQL